MAAATMSLHNSRAAGREYFVAVYGLPSNDGGLARPLDLATALSKASPARPGDTIWIRGGRYRGHFESHLSGTAAQPITVRNYEGERVAIDNPTDCDTMNLLSSYTWYWGLELTSTGSRRRTPESGSYCGHESQNHLDRGIGFRNNGSFNKIINCVIHDQQQGVGNWGTWTSNPGLEVYGSLIYYNGAEQTGGERDGWGLGHGIYTLSKQTGATRIRDNIVHSNFVTGIRVGDEGVFNPHVEGNISFLNGEHMTRTGGRNLYVGGGNNYDTNRSAYVPMSGAVIRANYTYFRTNNSAKGPGMLGASEGLNAGLWWPGASGEIVDNYVAGFSGGHALQLGYWDHFTATRCLGNTIYGTVNEYTKRQCPPDANTYLAARPPNAVFVRPNEFEPGRANIAIYNWERRPVVEVNLAAAGLSDGQAVEIRDAMNFFDSPIVRVNFRRTKPYVVIPMDELSRAGIVGETDISRSYRPLPHSAPEFAAFVVLPSGRPPR
jgi:hypothetical protein